MKPRAIILTTTLVAANAAMWLIFSYHPGDSPPSVPMVSPPPTGAAQARSSPRIPASARSGIHDAQADTVQSGKLTDSERAARNLAAIGNRRRQLTDPANHDKNLEGARARVERSKGPLFQRLGNIPPDKSSALRDVLAEADLRMSVAALPGVSPDGSPDPGGINEAMERVRQETEQQVAKLLGEDGLREYLAYQKSEPYRETLEQITSVMRARGMNVSGELQQKLLDGYAEAMSAATREAVMDRGSSLAGRAPTPALREQQLTRVDTHLAATMSRILDPDAYKIFMEAEFAQGGGSP